MTTARPGCARGGWAAGLLLFLSCPPLWAGDALYLELSAKGERPDVGLADFGGRRPRVDESDLARRIRGVVREDLLFPRLFNLVEGGPPPAPKKIPFDAWMSLGADALVTGSVESGWGGRFEFSGVLYDVASGAALLARKYSVSPGQERRVAHQWADDIMRYYTGSPGVATSRIVFVNDASGKKELYRVDYDGQNLERLTRENSIILFPRLSPDGRTVVYTTYRDGTPHLYLYDLEKRQSAALCRYEGLNSSAGWFPDSKTLVATLSMGRDPNLYVVDLTGAVLRVLTNSSSADTAPSLSPDGLHLAFTSDRLGAPQIYAMDTSGANIRRLSLSGQCDSPGWSPLGDTVVYAKSEAGGLFDIYTVNVGTGEEKRLTYGEGDNENPSWSPDGRFLVFTSTRRKKPELFMMNADGSNPHPLGDIPGRSFTPHWGGGADHR